MRYGTSHFRDKRAALRYYRAYGNDSAEVERKLAEGEIFLGPPTNTPAGSRVRIDPAEGRYFIEDCEP